MRYIIMIVFMLLSRQILQAEKPRTRNTIIACSVSCHNQKVDVINEYYDPRLFAELSVFPLNWLSAGFYYSPDYGSKNLLEWKNKSIGADIGLHSYPIFKWLKWNYLKDHLDVSIGGFCQQNLKKELFYGIEDVENHVIVPTDTPTIFEAKSKTWGKTFGITYFVINNVGLSAEIGKIGNKRYTDSQYKLGLIFRL